MTSIVAGTLVVLGALPVWGSIFGEENVTLVEILVQMTESKQLLDDLNATASEAADMTRDLLSSYQRVNAGIEELQHYSLDGFLFDLKGDFYNQYPGFAKLEYASQNLERWERTRTRSPWTAYQAITAVVADVTQPLREDIAAGHVNVDQELILAGESAGGMAIAHTAEDETRGFDEEAKHLYDMAQDASPAKAQQIQARTSLLLVKQQSHVMRLLSRAVRLSSVNAALDYGARIRSKSSLYEGGSTAAKLAGEALSPPPMMTFEASL
jgi:hypothetical protein